MLEINNELVDFRCQFGDNIFIFIPYEDEEKATGGRICLYVKSNDFNFDLKEAMIDTSRCDAWEFESGSEGDFEVPVDIYNGYEIVTQEYEDTFIKVRDLFLNTRKWSNVVCKCRNVVLAKKLKEIEDIKRTVPKLEKLEREKEILESLIA